MFWVYYCSVPIVAFVGLTIWETKVYQQRQFGLEVKLPSEKIWKFMEWTRDCSYITGRIIAHFVNPLFYIAKLWPHIQLYFHSAQRLITSISPPEFPGGSFMAGFCSNPLYGMTTLGFMLLCLLAYVTCCVEDLSIIIYTVPTILLILLAITCCTPRIYRLHKKSQLQRRSRRKRRLASQKSIEIDDSD